MLLIYVCLNIRTVLSHRQEVEFGVPRFREVYINAEGTDVRVGGWYDVMVKYCIPVEV
ncbi:MAG: hypothetical protein ACE5JU_22720 [Candidatus Binatia bacterium]